MYNLVVKDYKPIPISLFISLYMQNFYKNPISTSMSIPHL